MVPEYYAVLEAIPEPERFGIEVYNLGGGIKTGKNNTPLRLEAMLKEDRAHRRFSIISFDGGDVPANRKEIRNQVKQDNVVGSIFMHNPDFEFANFTAEELAEVIADGDSAVRRSGEAVREDLRSELKKNIASRKGKEWGRKLAAYAIENPRRSDNG